MAQSQRVESRCSLTQLGPARGSPGRARARGRRAEAAPRSRNLGARRRERGDGYPTARAAQGGAGRRRRRRRRCLPPARAARLAAHSCTSSRARRRLPPTADSLAPQPRLPGAGRVTSPIHRARLPPSAGAGRAVVLTTQTPAGTMTSSWSSPASPRACSSRWA